MPAPNLIAYIPTLNPRYFNWFAQHRGADLFLITHDEAKVLLPRLDRNMAALPTSMISKFLEVERAEAGLRRIWTFAPTWNEPNLTLTTWKDWVLPDEDISHIIAEKYLKPAGCNVRFEMIWARWDMQAVISQQPVIPDVEITSDELAVKILKDLKIEANKSPDWWRQVAAAVLDRQGRRLAVAHNTHMPNEYEVYTFGDPAINRDAGQPGKSCACHAEMGAIAECARHGYVVDGGTIYVTTFPCETCAGIIAVAGIKEVYFKDGYSTLTGLTSLRSRQVKLIQVKETPDQAT